MRFLVGQAVFRITHFVIFGLAHQDFGSGVPYLGPEDNVLGQDESAGPRIRGLKKSTNPRTFSLGLRVAEVLLGTIAWA